MPVLGIGGLFFRARDPETLSAWYREHLGVGGDPVGGGWYWQTAAGPVVFAPLRADTDYFAADKQWMLNLRVHELDALVEVLATKGVTAERRAEWDAPETGRFARIHDPEGNCGSRRRDRAAHDRRGNRGAAMARYAQSPSLQGQASARQR